VWKLDQPQRPQWEHRLTSLAYATCFCGPNRVAVGGMFEQILVFDVASGSIVHRVEGAQRSGCMMYDAERQRLISGHGDGRLRVHEGPEFTSRYTLNADAGEIKCIARSPDNACYLSGDVQGNLRLWSAEHCELVGNIHTCPKQSIIAGLQWNTFQQELIVFFFGDALGDPAQPSSGLHLRAFSAR
jgi:WD40 repeat protein